MIMSYSCHFHLSATLIIPTSRLHMQVFINLKPQPHWNWKGSTLCFGPSVAPWHDMAMYTCACSHLNSSGHYHKPKMDNAGAHNWNAMFNLMDCQLTALNINLVLSLMSYWLLPGMVTLTGDMIHSSSIPINHHSPKKGTDGVHVCEYAVIY